MRRCLCLPGLKGGKSMSRKRRPEWKVRMRKSNYASNLGQDVPMVYHPRNYTLEDIIALMDAHLSLPVTKENLEMCVKMFMDQVENLLLEGSIVNLPIGRLTPSVTGVWEPSDRRDPSVRALNRPTVSYAPGARLRARLEREVLLQDRVGSTRFYVHSVGSRPGGDSDGKLTPGKLVFVEGSQLLMNGDLPERGVYLLRADTQETVLHVTPADIDICTRGRIVFLLPADIAPGQYLLKVVSQCSTSPRPLKKAREYLWAGELKIEN